MQMLLRIEKRCIELLFHSPCPNVENCPECQLIKGQSNFFPTAAVSCHDNHLSSLTVEIRDELPTIKYVQSSGEPGLFLLSLLQHIVQQGWPLLTFAVRWRFHALPQFLLVRRYFHAVSCEKPDCLCCLLKCKIG